MKDLTGVYLRLREDKVIGSLKRSIPGEYRTVTEAEHPALLAAGFDFEFARVCTDCPVSVPSLFVSETLSEQKEPVAGVKRGQGEWTFILDTSHGIGAASLWLLCIMDFPDRFLKGLPELSSGSGAVLMRPMKCGWLVGLQSLLLKSIIKNGRRNPEF